MRLGTLFCSLPCPQCLIPSKGSKLVLPELRDRCILSWTLTSPFPSSQGDANGLWSSCLFLCAPLTSDPHKPPLLLQIPLQGPILPHSHPIISPNEPHGTSIVGTPHFPHLSCPLGTQPLCLKGEGESPAQSSLLQQDTEVQFLLAFPPVL